MTADFSPQDTVRLIHALQDLGLSDEQFRSLHHRQRNPNPSKSSPNGYIAYIEEQKVKSYRTGSKNADYHRRLALVFRMVQITEFSVSEIPWDLFLKIATRRYPIQHVPGS